MASRLTIAERQQRARDIASQRERRERQYRDQAARAPQRRRLAAIALIMLGIVLGAYGSIAATSWLTGVDIGAWREIRPCAVVSCDAAPPR